MKATRIYCDSCDRVVDARGFDERVHLDRNVIRAHKHWPRLDVKKIVHTMRDRTYHVTHRGDDNAR